MKPDCSRCLLGKYWREYRPSKKERGPAPTSRVTLWQNSTPANLLLLEGAPSLKDVDHGTPISDENGVKVMGMLRSAPLFKFAKVGRGTTICCPWPKGQQKALTNTFKKTQKANPDTQWLRPEEACGPYVRAQLSQYKTIVPMGPTATKFILPGNPSLESVRGGPTFVGEQKVVPTYSRWQVSINPHLAEILRSDLRKAIRHHTDTLNWKDPQVTYNPTVEEARAFFAKVKAESTSLTYDVETDAKDALTAGLRCIGIGTTDTVINIGFLSIDGHTRFYSPEEETRMMDLLCDVFLDPDILKVGHNAGYYDRIVVEQHLGVTPAPLLDTILLHRLAASEHKHRLGLVGSILTDVPAWKADHSGVSAKTDAELHQYCATDVAVTAALPTALIDIAKERDQYRLLEFDNRLQALCVGMKRMGIRIDETQRSAHELEQTVKAAECLEKIHKVVPDLNPRSSLQMRRLLFDDWDLPIDVDHLTASGEPSVGAPALRAIITAGDLEPDQVVLINTIRAYNKAKNLLSTFLTKFRPDRGIVRDGYVHPDYHCHGTVARFSSSDPNFQNIPHFLRDMFIPRDGHVFVGADYDQLEFRFAAALAGCEFYLGAFREKKDPYNITGAAMFGESFWEQPGAPDNPEGKGTGAFKKLRNLAKTICLASLYGAGPKMVYEIVSRAEDDDGNMAYAHLNLQQIRLLHTEWKSRAHEFETWWNATAAFRKNHLYVEEVVMGRRRYFIEEDFNAQLNFGAQAGGFAVVSQGMLELVENHIPFNHHERSGLVNQLHDAVLFTVKEEDADYLRDVVTSTLTRRVPALDILFTAEASIGTTWKEV